MTLADWKDTIAVVVSVATLAVAVTMRIQDRKRVREDIKRLGLENTRLGEYIADAPHRRAMADAELEHVKAETKQALAEAEHARVDSDLLRRKLDTAEQRVEELNRQVAELFLHAMSDAMYKDLVKLEEGWSGHFEMNDGLIRELRHLREIGYVALTGRSTAISTIPGEGYGLTQFVSITDSGRRFVALRRKADQLVGNTPQS